MAKKSIGRLKTSTIDKELFEDTDKVADNRIIVEEPDMVKANELALSGEFCQPKYAEKRDCYILIRKKSKQK